MIRGARVSILTALALSACHPSERAQVPVRQTASVAGIAQRCPELLAPRPPSSTAPRVLVELSQLWGDVGAPIASSPPATPLAGPFDDPRLEVHRVTQVLATNDVPSLMAWDSLASTPSANQPQRWDLKVTAHFDGAAPSALRLELDLSPAPPLGTPPESWSIPAHRRVHTTVVIAEQQPVMLALPPGAGTTGPSMMVVMPYFIRDEADLRRLFQCKMRQRRSHASF
jgi:hypothetical protein